MESLESTKELLSQLSPLQIGAVILALLFLIIGLRLILKKPPTHLTAFSGDSGKVLVSRKALQELVKQACLLDDWVDAARPIIRVKDQKVTARVELRLSKPENLKEVCERVQARVTALLQKSLSFEQIGEIQIVVRSFASDAEKPPPPDNRPEQPPTKLVTSKTSTIVPERPVEPQAKPKHG